MNKTNIMNLVWFAVLMGALTILFQLYGCATQVKTEYVYIKPKLPKITPMPPLEINTRQSFYDDVVTNYTNYEMGRVQLDELIKWEINNNGNQ